MSTPGECLELVVARAERVQGLELEILELKRGRRRWFMLGLIAGSLVTDLALWILQQVVP